MKLGIVALFTFVICLSASGLVFPSLLDDEDFEFQFANNELGAALGSEIQGEQPWESFNQWQCFRLESIRFECAAYDSEKFTPSLRVETQSEVFLFDTHVEDRLDCEHTLSIWRRIGTGGRDVCVFAARMPEVNLGSDGSRLQSLWYINRLKGENGYWDLNDSIF